MTNDPIVNEIHKTRQRILAECDGDVEKMIARLKTLEDQDKDRLVTLEEVQKRAGI